MRMISQDDMAKFKKKLNSMTNAEWENVFDQRVGLNDVSVVSLGDRPLTLQDLDDLIKRSLVFEETQIKPCDAQTNIQELLDALPEDDYSGKIIMLSRKGKND